MKQLVSGTVAGIVLVATAISYCALIFLGPLAPQLDVGIGYGLVSAGICAIGFALWSEIPFAIAGPDSRSVAVLSRLATVTAAGSLAAGAKVGPTVLMALLAGTLITGLCLYLFGALRLGRWIRYVPYPVVGGFLAASGWVMVSGTVRLITSYSLTVPTIPAILRSPHFPQLAVAIGFACVLGLSRRSRSPLMLPLLLLCGGLLLHSALYFAGITPEAARQAGWLLNSHAAAFPLPAVVDAARTANWHVLLEPVGEYAALVVVTATTLLLGTSSIEVAARMEIDADHELKLNGILNLFTGAAGGMVGTLSISRTLFNLGNGATGRTSGIVAGLICLFPLAIGPGAVSYIPLPILGGMLLQMGGSMLDEWLIKGWKRASHADYIQIMAIVFAITYWDFLAGIMVGVVLACITFAITSSRIPLVRRSLSRGEFASRVERPREQQQVLLAAAAQIRIMWLQGFIFFGSATRLVNTVKKAAHSANAGAARAVILDFRQVLGIDTSSLLSFQKLRQFAERESLRLVFSSLPEKVEQGLRQIGFFADPADDTCRLFENIDAAIEYCENRLLAETGSTRIDPQAEQTEFAIALGDPSLSDRLQPFIERVALKRGETLFAQGDAADSLYFVVNGRVSILFNSLAGDRLRLRSMSRHTLVGEMGLYRGVSRAAQVLADEASILFRISQESLGRMEQDDPELAHIFHKFVVRTLAARLDFANREVAGLV